MTTAKEALEELRSVCPQYGYPRFDVLAKVITDELDGIAPPVNYDKVDMVLEELRDQGKLL